jgi:putative transposase
MTKKQFRNFSAEEKGKIVLELLKEDATLSQLSSKYEVSSNSISYWKKQFLSNAAIAFEPAKVVSEYQAEINKLREQNDELAKALGKLR